MFSSGQLLLAIGGAFSTLAAAAHLVCILIGAPAYRLMGAGERMAKMAELGKLEPTLVTLFVTAVLVILALYAFSGAGLLPKLPLLKPALCAITIIYLCRALAFPLIKGHFPDNSPTFWYVSSGVCLVIGALHLLGLIYLWQNL